MSNGSPVIETVSRDGGSDDSYQEMLDRFYERWFGEEIKQGKMFQRRELPMRHWTNGAVPEMIITFGTNTSEVPPCTE